MSSYRVEASFAGRLVVLGTGCVAEGLLPLLWRHIELQRERVLVLGPESDGETLATRHRVDWRRAALSPHNVADELARLLRAGDMVLNLALDVDSLDTLAWCQRHDVLYLDTNLESWPDDARALSDARSRALACRRDGACTGVIAHGANPGLVTHFVKQALTELAPTNGDWPAAAMRLGLRMVQVSEFDSHAGGARLAEDEFANTWSARGLAGELLAPVELGWGRHESTLPAGASLRRTARGTVAQLAEAGHHCVVRSWAPSAGCFDAFVLAHHEAMSISDMLTAGHGAAHPTVLYAVRPCAAALRAATALGTRAKPAAMRFRVLKNELQSGGNELGVLLLGEQVGQWYGSRLSLAQARALAPGNNATSLQVVAGVLGAVVWMLENRRRGVVEAEDMDFERVLEVAAPYLGELGNVPTYWRPAEGLEFKRFRVVHSAKEQSRSDLLGQEAPSTGANA